MAKYTFTHTVEWSDWSEHSPQHRGQWPCAIVLPDGERVEIDEYARYSAGAALYEARMKEGSRATYAQIHPNVRVRESHWGDDGSRRMGRAGSKLEMLAPKGSTFLFARNCPWCGEKAGEQEIPYEGRWDRKAKSLYHESCKAESDEQERLIEEQRRYVEEQERLADEEWEREFGHLLKKGE